MSENIFKQLEEAAKNLSSNELNDFDEDSPEPQNYGPDDIKPFKPKETSEMNVDELIDKYEAGNKIKKRHYTMAKEEEEEEEEQEALNQQANNEENQNNTQSENNSSDKNNETSSDSGGGGGGDEDDESKLAKIKDTVQALKESPEYIRQCIEDYKQKLKDKFEQRKKWNQVLKKARQDNNWKKYNVPKWRAKFHIKKSDNEHAKNILKKFENSDKDIKRNALKGQAKLKLGGSLKKAEETMENIKATREEMVKLAPEIKFYTGMSLLERIPQIKLANKLGCAKFIPQELTAKIFDAENPACTNGCTSCTSQSKMIMLTALGSSVLGSLLAILLNI